MKTKPTIIRYAQLPSTNDFMMKNKNLFSSGMVINTWFQSKGHGMGTNRWESDYAKNLLLSMFYKPRGLKAEKQFVLNMAVSLSIKKLLEDEGMANIQIKWPNDVLANKKKIAGILISNILQGEHIQNSIIGVGLNVNQTIFSKNIPQPVSMKMLSGKDYDLKILLNNFHQVLLNHMAEIDQRNDAWLKEAYLSALYQKGSWHSYQAGRQMFQGMITGISPYGHLEVKNKEDKTSAFDFKEIKFL